MATLAVGHESIVGGREERKNISEKLSAVFSSVARVFEPYFSAVRLDFSEPGFRASLTTRERAVTDSNLNSVHTNFA